MRIRRTPPKVHFLSYPSETLYGSGSLTFTFLVDDQNVAGHVVLGDFRGLLRLVVAWILYHVSTEHSYLGLKWLNYMCVYIYIMCVYISNYTHIYIYTYIYDYLCVCAHVV